MPKGKTQNYELNQWEKTDQVLMEDFNADNAKLDTALAELAARSTDAETTLTQKGNCSIGYFTYTGTGASPTTINFPRRPLAFIVSGFGGIMFGWGSRNYIILANGAQDSATWSGSQLKVPYIISTNEHYAFLNSKTSTYNVIAFYAEG